jgi:5,5'-dehydrodivanillate O-demethylase
VDQKPQHRLAFRVPADDTKTLSYVITFYPGSGSKLIQETKGLQKRQSGHYGHVDDGYWGIESHDQDVMVLEGLGQIFDRTTEHLAATDRGVAMLRKMILESIEAVSKGNDPIGVLKGEQTDGVISFDASIQEIEALSQAVNA